MAASFLVTTCCLLTMRVFARWLIHRHVPSFDVRSSSRQTLGMSLLAWLHISTSFSAHHIIGSWTQMYCVISHLLVHTTQHTESGCASLLQDWGPPLAVWLLKKYPVVMLMNIITNSHQLISSSHFHHFSKAILILSSQLPMFCMYSFFLHATCTSHFSFIVEEKMKLLIFHSFLNFLWC